MADSFNPYVEWLGLSADQTEPNHYQLLSLAEFEADSTRIAIAADRAMSRVRSFRPGSNAKAWSKLLDELLLAKGRLLDPERKAEYDKDLREQASQPGTAASAPALSGKSDSVPRVGQDSRFPPGMGPNGGRAAPAPQQKPEDPRPAEPPRESAPAISPISPPSLAPVAPSPAPVAPLAAPAPLAQPALATAWPTSMLHPVPHAPHPAPTGQPAYAAPQPQGGYPSAPAAYPMAAPVYGMQPAPYGQPGYPQQQYAPPQYPPQGPYAVPAYGSSPYGQPPAASPYAGGHASQPPMHEPPQMYGGHPGYVASPPLPAYGATMDPMAPVALPVALPGSEDAKQGRVVGFAGAAAGAASATIPTGTIPKGKAVSSAPNSPSSGSSAPDQLAPSSPAPAGSEVPRKTLGDMPSSGQVVSSRSFAPNDLVTRTEPTATEKNILYGTIGAVVLLVGAIAFAIANANKNAPDLANNPGPTVPEPKPLPRFEPVTTIPATPPKPEPAKPPKPGPQNTRPMNDPAAMPEQPAPTTPDPLPTEPKPEPTKPEAPEPEPEPAKPIPTPPPPTPPEPPAEVKLTPVELATLSKSMTTARDALSERNFEEFDKQFAAANQLAKSAEQKAKVDRLMMLGAYVKQFDEHLKTLLADPNFDAGAELVVGKGTRVVVVERTPTNIVIRISGINKSYSVANLPDGLAMALIDKRLIPGQPEAKLVKGAYFAAAKVVTDETRAKAKELWEEATKEGADAGDLALVLTDTYDFKE